MSYLVEVEDIECHAGDAAAEDTGIWVLLFGTSEDMPRERGGSSGGRDEGGLFPLP